MLKKGLAVAVILLLVGISVVPSITGDIERTSDNKELVEITVDICGFDKTDSHKVSLSRKDADRLDALIDKFEEKIDNTANMEDTFAAYNWLIMKLYKIGLLDDTSVKEIKKIVSINYKKAKIFKLLDRQYTINNDFFDENRNYFCMISGHCNQLTFQGIFLTALLIKGFKIRKQIDLSGCFLLSGLVKLLHAKNFFEKGGTIFSGYKFDGEYRVSSEGWIWTLGLNGIKKWENSFHGSLCRIDYHAPYGYYSIDYVGAVGFAGVKIGINPLYGEYFILGNALCVSLSENHSK